MWRGEEEDKGHLRTYVVIYMLLIELQATIPIMVAPVALSLDLHGVWSCSLPTVGRVISLTNHLLAEKSYSSRSDQD